MPSKKEYCTIYLLTNTIDNKKYVGQSWYDLHIRMGKYGENYKHSTYLYNAIQKHGVENFEYSVLEKCSDQITANEKEVYYIELYNTRNLDIGYNLKEGGSHGQHSQQTIKKISDTLIERGKTPEEMEFIVNLGKAWKDVERGPQTEERKEQTSSFMTDWHANNTHPMLGKQHTEDARVAIGNGVRGIVRDPAIVAQGAAKRKIKEDFVKQMLAAYAVAKKSPDGVNAKALATQLGTNTTTLYRKLKENGVVLASPKLSMAKTGKPQNKSIVVKPPIPTFLPDLTREQTIIAAYQNTANTIKDIETAFTITAPTIYVIMKRNGISLRTR